MLKVKSKRAIAMIELIFSLVIMGIVLLSSPMLIQQSIRSGEVALQQESIAAAAAQTGVILSANWDESNTNLGAGTSPILDNNRTLALGGAGDILAFNNGILPGLLGVSGRVALNHGVPKNASVAFGIDNPELEADDVDDYNNTHLGITIYDTQSTSADTGDYVDANLSMHTLVNYVEDRPAPSAGTYSLNSTDIDVGGSIATEITVPTNIKMITVKLTSNSGIAELDKNIVLKAFSCNIGTFQPQGVPRL